MRWTKEKKKYKEKCSFMRGEVARLILRRFPCTERRRIKERKGEREEEEKKRRRRECDVFAATEGERGAKEVWFMRLECVRTQLPF